jgi:hypothetical protein
VIRPADQDSTARDLLEVTFQAKSGVAHGEHPGVDGAVGVVAGGASFAQSFMLEDEGTTLSSVATEARVALRQQRCATTQVG